MDRSFEDHEGYESPQHKQQHEVFKRWFSRDFVMRTSSGRRLFGHAEPYVDPDDDPTFDAVWREMSGADL